jgi:hypothetical protein
MTLARVNVFQINHIMQIRRRLITSMNDSGKEKYYVRLIGI